MKTDVLEQTPQSQAQSTASPRAGAQMPDQAEMLRKMEAAGTPGPAHQVLKQLVGSWKAEVKCWMDPSAPPAVSAGTSKANLVFGGRFLEEEFHGEMMGRPFTGKTLMGFDNTKQTYNSVWFCDTQTSLVISEGKADSANKVITLECHVSCPGTGQKDMPMKSIYRILGPDKHTFEMFDSTRNVRTMEITYTRQ